MKRGRAILAALLTAPVACAPLIDFDALTAGDAGPDASMDGGNDAAEASVEASTESSVEAGADATDARDGGPDSSDPCNAVSTTDNGYYCWTSRENGFAGGATNTLYDCVDGQAAMANLCTPDCIVSPATYPDTCDDCSTKPNGTWCGSEFPGYLPRLANVKFTCVSGQNNGTPVACGPPTPTCKPGDGGATCAP